MKVLQRLFLLSVLGLGVLVHEIQASDQTNQKIDKLLLNKAEELQKLNLKDLKEIAKVLESLKVELTDLINKSPNPSNYAKLQEALNKLEPTAVYALLAPLKVILSHASDQARSQIKSKLPANLAVWL